MIYTKEKFKELWEANSCGSGITYDDIAECAKAWGISSHPRTRPIDEITYRVLKAAQVNDADLEKEIKNRIDSLSNLYCYMEDLFNGDEEEGVYPIPENVKNELFEFAKHFFELGLKTQKGE